MSTISILITISVFLLVAWLLPVLSGGYANTVDRIGLFLHRHAREVRRRQAERAKVLRGMWAEGKRRKAVWSDPVPIRKKEAV